MKRFRIRASHRNAQRQAKSHIREAFVLLAHDFDGARITKVSFGGTQGSFWGSTFFDMGYNIPWRNMHCAVALNSMRVEAPQWRHGRCVFCQKFPPPKMTDFRAPKLPNAFFEETNIRAIRCPVDAYCRTALPLYFARPISQ